jgi:hypothetical protein
MANPPVILKFHPKYNIDDKISPQKNYKFHGAA